MNLTSVLDLQASLVETRWTVATLLLTDLDLAGTFVTTAHTSSRPDIRRRNLENARQVCGLARFWLPRLGTIPRVRNLVELRVSAMEDQLAAFGVPLDGKG